MQEDLFPSPIKRGAIEAGPGYAPTSTVGRGKSVRAIVKPDIDLWSDSLTSVALGNSLDHYSSWPQPTVIISDGGYGILGFEGDTSDHLSLPEWYTPHVEAWAKAASPATTLWFWNSEIGWAAVHPLLEKHGWRYINANIWNKGKAHIAGNVNTTRIRRFPVVSEICVQYVYEAKIHGLPLKKWLLSEWKRAGLSLRKANEACGVADAAVRKYLDQGHLWYYPPPEMFERLQVYANTQGDPAGKPYFSIDGKAPGTARQWSAMRSKFNCPHGVTNVWDRPPLAGPERFRVNGESGRAVHLNQKPLDLTEMIVSTSSDQGDIVWEPFGGLFTASIAARRLRRRAFAAEIDPTYFYYGLRRILADVCQDSLPGSGVFKEEGPSCRSRDMPIIWAQ